MPIQVWVIARRSMNQTFRRPASILPPIIFPLMMLGINSSGLAVASKIPGFPARSYFDFAFVVTFMQGALFATTTAGLSIGRDVETGFLDRLALTPMRGSAMVIGQLAGAVSVALVAACVYLAVGLAFGVHIVSGIAGIPALALLAAITALAFAGIGAFIALRAGDSESVQGLFPLMFASLFLSTMSMPLSLMKAEWFRTIATFNPVSYVVDGLRSLVITGWDTSALVNDGLVLSGAIVIALVGCASALRVRLTRT